MAACLKRTIFVVALTVACVQLATTNVAPLTGDHVCLRKICVAEQKNESYISCVGCPRDHEPPINESRRDCRNLPLPAPVALNCPTSSTQLCYRIVTHNVERSVNVKHCCSGYVENKEGKCVRHHILRHMACQALGMHLRSWQPVWRCGTHATCVNESCVCARGYELDSADYHCIDIDECSTLHPCEHFCINKDGGYICDCKPSHDLHSNGHNCTVKTLSSTNPESVARQRSTTAASTAKSTTKSTAKSTAKSSTTSTTTQGTSNNSRQRARHRDDASTSQPLVGGLAAAAVLIVLVAAGALFYLRRRALKRQPQSSNNEPSVHFAPPDDHMAFENRLYQELPPRVGALN